VISGRAGIAGTERRGILGNERNWQIPCIGFGPRPVVSCRAAAPGDSVSRRPDPEDSALNDPNRNDVLLAIWSTLALSDEYDEFLATDEGEAVLEALYEDLHADLLEAEILMDEEFENWAVATG
jgi:hypothetical protein